MAAANWWSILEALATQLESLTNLTGATYAYEPDEPMFPCAILRPTSIPILGESFGKGLLRGEVGVVLIPGENVDRQAAETLYGWLSGGTGGVWETLRAAPTLGGLVADVVPGVAASLGAVDTAIGPRFGATVSVQIVVRRDA